MSKKGKKPSGKSRPRRKAAWLGLAIALLMVAYGAIACWFVHHPQDWRNSAQSALPVYLVNSLYGVGNVVGDLTDSFGLTGVDAIYEYDTAAPSGDVLFAGIPKRISDPAPDDIVVLDRREFKIGWSPSLKHPVWCAYHITNKVRFPTSRANFRRDGAVSTSTFPRDYEYSGYDRGHMVPNHAIVTRYGSEAQADTFKMTNIAPQTPQLNRGAWRDFEHRIADYWTAKYGEIWVIVGTIQGAKSALKLRGIDVPTGYYQIVVAQEGMDVRAMAILLPQRIRYDAFAARYLISIDELETLTGLDFLPDLPSFVQTPLEAQTPTRLWPIRLSDAFNLLLTDLKR